MDPEVGARVRQLRKLRGMRMSDLAEQAGCTESFISKIENGKASPSLRMLHGIVEVLGANMSHLFSPPDPGTGVVMRAGTRPFLESDARDEQGVRVERMILPSPEGSLQGGMFHVAPGSASGAGVTHVGEEFGYVLEGEIELIVEDQAYMVAAGDCFHFRSELPHGFRNVGRFEARILWINTPANF